MLRPSPPVPDVADRVWRIVHIDEAFGGRFLVYENDSPAHPVLRVLDACTGRATELPGSQYDEPCTIMGRHMYYWKSRRFVDVVTKKSFWLPTEYHIVRHDAYNNIANLLCDPQGFPKAVLFSTTSPPTIVVLPPEHMEHDWITWYRNLSSIILYRVTRPTIFLRVRIDGTTCIESGDHRPKAFQLNYLALGPYSIRAQAGGGLMVWCTFWTASRSVAAADIGPHTVRIVPGGSSWRVLLRGESAVRFVSLPGWTGGQRRLFVPGVRRLAALHGALGLRGAAAAAYQGWLSSF